MSERKIDMRNSAFAIVGLGVALSNLPLQASFAYDQTIDETIVYLECKSPNDQAPRKGSGVIIDPAGHVLTAKHVVFGDSLSLPDGTTCEGALGHAGLSKQQFTYKDHSQRYDAAILKMPPPQTGNYPVAKYCELTSDLLRQPIFATGFPSETKTNVPSSRVGVISTVEPDGDGLIETDSTTTEGMSGGMVTLGNSANLVGIVAGVKTGWTGLPDHYAVLAAQRLAQEFSQWGLTKSEQPCYRQSRIVELPDEIAKWDAADGPKKLGVRSDEAICYLAGIHGLMNHDGDRVTVALQNNEYVLDGQNLNGGTLGADVRCVWFE
jgi:Trypsin-like peptidase domain